MFLALTHICIPHTFVLYSYCKDFVRHMCVAPKFAGSNPAEAVGFLRAKKSSARLPSEGK